MRRNLSGPTRLATTTSAALAALLFLPLGAGAQDRDDLAEGQSSYVGAQLLDAEENVQVGGMAVGTHGDDEGRSRFMFWEGNSLFAGVVDDETGNRLEVVAEFYWFESSIDRNADFYLVVLKVTSTPVPNTNWRVATEEGWVDHVMLRDIGPVQQVESQVTPNGLNGAIRWDWSVPFQNYRWEPERVIEVQQTYAAGVQAEGGAMASVTEGVNIQAKGVLSANHQVQSRYTITLWRWQMLVLAGATDMSWNLVALDPEHAEDPAYHEYFLVAQAERGRPVHLNFLRFASTLRESVWWRPDSFMRLSASLEDVTLSAPTQPIVCEAGYEVIGDECERICPEGFNFMGGDCVLECDDGFENVDGACRPVCLDGFIADGDKCVPDCDAGFRAEGNACIRDCPPGYVDGAGGCQLDCPDDSHPEGDRCVLNCPRGTYEDGGRCIEIPDRLQCGPGTHQEGDSCVADDAPPVEDSRAECALHSDCPIGSHCDADRCVSRCLVDNDCGSGSMCNERAMCVPGQADGLGGGLAGSAKAQQVSSADSGCAMGRGTNGLTGLLHHWLRR